MRSIKRTSLPLLLLLVGVLACALPGVPQTDPNAVDTAVALTLQSILQMTQDAGSSVSLDSTATPTLPPTDTLAPDQPTFTPTATSTPSLTPTPIVLAPMISVSVATNCRVGPGKIYQMVGALLVGETVQVYARSPSNDYWYIRNPDNPNQFCWVWGEYATVTGLISTLPVYTPPPSPTPTHTSTPSPAYEMSYGGLESCSGSWWVDIDIKNTGTLTFQSVSLTVKDSVTSTVVTAIGDGFTDKTGCGASTKKKVLGPGKTVGQSSPAFGYDINGHKLRATLTLCSKTGLNGNCVTDTLTFKP